MRCMCTTRLMGGTVTDSVITTSTSGIMRRDGATTGSAHPSFIVFFGLLAAVQTIVQGKEMATTDRQEKLRQYGIELPDIPGLPVEVIPLHVHAIQVTTKLFQKNGAFSQSCYNSHGQPNTTSATIAAGGSVLDSILQRVGETAAAAEDNNTEETARKHRQEWQKHLDALSSWLNGIQRFAREHKHNPKQNMSVPVVALRHLFELGLEHRRWPIRRATLLLAGILLQKSAECRKWWLGDGDDDNAQSSSASKKLPLMTWMNIVLVVEEDRHAAVAVARRLWQREAYQLLLEMESKGYGDYYPTLSVAVQRFQQMCPPGSLLAEESTTVSTQQQRNMADWRQLRKASMDHWEEMDKRLQRQLNKAQECMDILVPRMDGSAEEKTAVEKYSEESNPAPGEENKQASEEQVDDEDDDDNDDIDWEDGWEDPVEETHAEAVERTMEAMRSTGGIHEEGLEISFTNDEDGRDDDRGNEKPSVDVECAKERLDKIVNRLSTRYMPRLSLWVEGLTNADALVEQPSGALIEMSSIELSHRKSILERCIEMKRQVARILTASKRLGMNQKEDTNEIEDECRPVARRPGVTDLIGARQNRRLASNLSRKRQLLASHDRTRKRSNRIKIKFGKR